MRLEPLYRIRFTYPEGWMIGLEGGWEQHLFLAEGRCEGSITGRFRGANFPRRRTETGPFRPDFRAVIEADDGATIMDLSDTADQVLLDREISSPGRRRRRLASADLGETDEAERHTTGGHRRSYLVPQATH